MLGLNPHAAWATLLLLSFLPLQDRHLDPAERRKIFVELEKKSEELKSFRATYAVTARSFDDELARKITFKIHLKYLKPGMMEILLGADEASYRVWISAEGRLHMLWNMGEEEAHGSADLAAPIAESQKRFEKYFEPILRHLEAGAAERIKSLSRLTHLDLPRAFSFNVETRQGRASIALGTSFYGIFGWLDRYADLLEARSSIVGKHILIKHGKEIARIIRSNGMLADLKYTSDESDLVIELEKYETDIDLEPSLFQSGDRPETREPECRKLLGWVVEDTRGWFCKKARAMAYASIVESTDILIGKAKQQVFDCLKMVNKEAYASYRRLHVQGIRDSVREALKTYLEAEEPTAVQKREAILAFNRISQDAFSRHRKARGAVPYRIANQLAFDLGMKMDDLDSVIVSTLAEFEWELLDKMQKTVLKDLNAIADYMNGHTDKLPSWFTREWY
jgi:hypothetical protein